MNTVPVGRGGELVVPVAKRAIFGPDLITLKDMQDQKVIHAFYVLSKQLDEFLAVTKDSIGRGSLNNSNAVDNVFKVIEECPDLAEYLGFSATAIYLRLMEEKRKNGEWPTVDDATNMLRFFGVELNTPRFKVLMDDESKWYESRAPFGIIVAKKFKDVAGDITEINRCLALGRYTGSVFHSMRLLEYGVHRLADKLGVILSVVNTRGKNQNKEWGALCDEIVAKVRNLPDSTPQEQKERLNLEDMSEHLSNVRMERNRVMHARYASTKRYTKAKATDVRNEVESFMRKLAESLPDVGTQIAA
jgi:hypothetical protein